jgi:hypothetical protein
MWKSKSKCHERIRKASQSGGYISHLGELWEKPCWTVDGVIVVVRRRVGPLG